MNGTDTDVRVLDAWLKPPLTWVHDRLPWLRANHITITRFALLPFFYWFAVVFPPLLLPLCHLDSLSDMADGVWARLFGEDGKVGKFLDQFSDKVSNWTRTLILYYIAVPAIYLDLGATHSLFWTLLFVSFACDMFNLALRIYYLFNGETGKGSSIAFGKVKTWCQGYGISLFAITYAGDYCVNHPDEFWVYCALVIGMFIGTVCLIPPRRGRKWYNDALWHSLAGANLALVALVFSSDTRYLAHAAGEAAFYVSVLLSLFSTGGQLHLHRRR